jgi:DNA-binding transcriptional LysR family regulator
VELRQLRYFVAVAELLHFTRAARMLHMAQPPLSRQIQALEKELGVQLLERNSSSVSLTRSGAIFLEEAKAVLKRAEQAIRTARATDTGQRGIVRIGIGLGLGESVSRVIDAHLPLYPNVDLDVVNILSGYQSVALTSHEIDVGFLRPPVDNSKIASEKILKEGIAVVVRKSSPLARRKGIRLKQIADEPLLMFAHPISPGVYDKVLDLFRERGLEPHMIQTESTPLDEAGAIMVDSGKGIFIAIGASMRHPHFADRLIVVPIADPGAYVEAHIAWRQNESVKAILNFVEFTRRFFKKKAASDSAESLPKLYRLVCS